MKKFITDKNLTLINFTIVLYFILIWAIHVSKIDFVVLNFFRELLTIPFLMALIVFTIISIRYLFKPKKKALTIISILVLFICSIVIFLSFEVT